MLTKNAGWISATTSFALAAALAGCSGGGSGGAGFHVSTCSLGCSGGEGGGQINCGVVGIAENQEISLLFTSPVDPGSINKESFVVRDAISNASAAGSRFVDPGNPNRLVFRPKLTIGDNGEPIFGFEAGKAYQVFLNGTVQKDPLPYVLNEDGRENETRVACTVQASQGIVDTIPGKPSVSVFVTVQPSGGEESQVQLQLNQVPGATDVKTFSSLVFEFDELMDISSILDPSTGIAPGVDVMLDLDGSLASSNDRVEIVGSYNFGFDQNAQTTSLSFTPDDGFPSLGSDANEPRLVVVVLDDNIQDIAGNGIDQPGTYSFVPQQIAFPIATLPAGGEQFVDQLNLDAPVSGSAWGTAVSGRLTPGEGGGSGRHGELHVAAGETLVLHSSGAKAWAEVEFTAKPFNNDELTIAGVSFIFKLSPGTNPLHVPIRYSLSYTVSSFVEVVRAYAAANPSSQVATATYTQSDLSKVRVEAIAPGIPSPSFVLLVEPTGTNPIFATLSSGTLSGGFVAHTFTGSDLVTNFDFDAGTGTPGGTPPDLLVDNGVFEFSRVVIEPTATVVLAGTNPVRLLVRGDFELADLALIDLSGDEAGPHISATPFGQPGGFAGPNAGTGGRGGDRSSQPHLANEEFNGGITLENPQLAGSNGLGVGGVSALGGEGLGGVQYPAEFPTTTPPVDYKGWAHNAGCSSGMMGNTGSGGAYSMPGVRGQTKVVDATGTSTLGEVSNKPIDNTVGGSADEVGLEPASSNPTGNRLLSPGLDDLRGGSGGGGGGAHVGSTISDLFGSSCLTSDFFVFTDNSGAGGGGGGGALQVQAGGTLALTGQIDAGGGAGGSSSSAVATLVGAAPGGGGSGGAVLIQGGTLELAQQPSRILVDGGAAGVGGWLVVPSTAGPGSPGIVRVEQSGTGPDATAVAASTFPTDPLDPTSVKWLSAGAWVHNAAKDEFESVTGSQSCWMQVDGSHFSLLFLDDAAAPALPADMGWNMDVIIDEGLGAGEVTVPWRGSDGNGPFLGLYPEEVWGTLLNRDLGVGETASPIVVRFQGAATDGELSSPCEADPDDPSGPFKVGSVTPWVRHPRELNDFVPLPTVVRFLVLFDRSHADFGKIKGVTNLRIVAQPE